MIPVFFDGDHIGDAHIRRISLYCRVLAYELSKREKKSKYITREYIREVEEDYMRGYLITVKEKTRALVKALKNMVFMEEKILFPTSVRKPPPQAWSVIRRGGSCYRVLLDETKSHWIRESSLPFRLISFCKTYPLI